jgi:hypothetical protein
MVPTGSAADAAGARGGGAGVVGWAEVLADDRVVPSAVVSVPRAHAAIEPVMSTTAAKVLAPGRAARDRGPPQRPRRSSGARTGLEIDVEAGITAIMTATVATCDGRRS